MEIRAGGESGRIGGKRRTGMLLDVPSALIKGFAEAEIKGEFGMCLPFETKVHASTQTICGWDGEGIKHIVLVEVNAVVPITGIKPLKS